MKSRWQSRDKIALTFSLILGTAWALAAVYELIPGLWPNIIAGFIPPIPLWLRVLQTGLPKPSARKGGFEQYPVEYSIFTLAAAVDLAALNLLSERAWVS